MFDIDSNTVLVGSTDLRTRIPEISSSLKNKKIIIMKRNKPIAVIQDFEKFQEAQKKIEEMEDLILGYLAKNRKENSKKKDFLTFEKAAKELGIKV